MPRGLALHLPFAALLAALSLVHSRSSAQSGFAGTYRASPQQIVAEVTTWGEDCGPKPESIVLNDQPLVEVTEAGAHLSLRFPDRTIRTDGCWSPNPAVKPASTTVANGRFVSECRTQAGDAKRERGRYTLSASPGRLVLVEESNYDWQLKESHCVAKVRITQTLTTKDRTSPVVEAQPEPTPKPGETSCVAGAPVRLRLRPTDARIGPGERVCFSVRAFDSASCAADLADSDVTYQLTRPPGADGALQGSCFKAASNAALAEGVFRVAAVAGGLRTEVALTVSAPDLSDITARRVASGNGPAVHGRAGDETVLESGIRAVASGSHGLLWLGLAVATLALLLCVGAIVALRFVRRQALAQPAGSVERVDEQEHSARTDIHAPAPGIAPSIPVPASGPPRICPKCRRGYAPGTDRCAIDNELLVDYGEFARRAEATAPRHCPECGEKLASDAAFCGRCGHKVAQ